MNAKNIIPEDQFDFWRSHSFLQQYIRNTFENKQYCLALFMYVCISSFRYDLWHDELLFSMTQLFP